MAETIKVRLRSMAFHHGRRLKPGTIVSFSMDDMVEGKLPNWAEKCEETDLEVLARHMSAKDAERDAREAQRQAEKDAAAAAELAEKAKQSNAKADKAKELAEKRAKSK